MAKETVAQSYKEIENSSEDGEKKLKFHTLAPITLEKNKAIYTELLKDSLVNIDVKNIAIAGLYGSGKSTVWKTYVKEQNLQNIITISLGKYEKEENNTITSQEENVIERQIINQIIVQIDNDKIPLSKYKIKANKTKKQIIKQVALTMITILALIGLFLNSSIVNAIKDIYPNFKALYYILTMGSVFTGVISFILYRLFRDNTIRLSKVNIQGAEAEFEQGDMGEESVLHKDMKEIIYLLRSSQSKYIVFEDLDRFNSTSIFTKLRELNFLLNKNYECDGLLGNVKFIYMVRGGLFNSKDRTKFFDVIIPILPVVDASNSASIFMSEFKDVLKRPDERVITILSNYIDEIRVVYSILNDYKIYSELLSLPEPIKKKEYSSVIEKEWAEYNMDDSSREHYNKLFGLIVLKNVFTKEFDELQLNKGCIYKLVQDKKKLQEVYTNILEKESAKVQDDIKKIEDKLQLVKYKEYASHIPEWFVDKDRREPWEVLLKDLADGRYSFLKVGGEDYNFEDIVKMFNLKVKSGQSRTYKNTDRLIKEKKRLEEKHFIMNSDSIRINVLSIKELLTKVDSITKDNHFNSIGAEIKDNPYFNLIKVLILEGLLDETYSYYRSYFHPGCLGANDKIYLQTLYAGSNQDLFLRLDNPQIVINHLNIDDFKRPNILNASLLEFCLREEQYKKYVESFIESDFNSTDLIKVLEQLEIDELINFVKLGIYSERILNILTSPLPSALYKKILITMLLSYTIPTEIIDEFKDSIESRPELLSKRDISTHLIQLDDTLKNYYKLKFKWLYNSNASKETISVIEKNNAYTPDATTLNYIVNTLLPNLDNYQDYLDAVCSHGLFHSSKNYILDNFDEFMSSFIAMSNNKNGFKHPEEIVIRVCNSNLSEKEKELYLRSNHQAISDLSYLSDLEEKCNILNILSQTNMITFNSHNLGIYSDIVDIRDKYFMDFVDRNITAGNYEIILEDLPAISNEYINYPEVSDKVFDYCINMAKNNITSIDENLNKERVLALIQHKLIKINNNNLCTLMKWDDVLEVFIDSLQKEDQEEAIYYIKDWDINSEDNVVLDHYYKLINRNLEEDIIQPLLDKLYSYNKLEISRLDITKEGPVKYLIDRDLNKDSINYLCHNFEQLASKEYFIEYVDKHNDFHDIEAQNITSDIIKYLLEHNISTTGKMDILETMINNKHKVEMLEPVIRSIPSIADLADVWHGKNPVIDNSEKEKISRLLITNKYVVERQFKGKRRIKKL